MSKLTLYILNKLFWFLIAFVVALVVNFTLIRLIPGNPVDALIARMSSGGSISGDAMNKIYDSYFKQFGLDRPLWPTFLGPNGDALRVFVLVMGVALIIAGVFFSLRRIGPYAVLRAVCIGLGGLLVL